MSLKNQKIKTSLLGNRIYIKKHDEYLAETMFYYVDSDRERLGKFLPWVLFSKTVQDELNYIRHTHRCWDDGTIFDFGIFLKENNLYIGNIGVHTIHWKNNRCEIGYWILGKFEGQGYVSEAVRLLEKHLFEIGFHRIEIRCSSLNFRSANVPVSCGYFFEGILKDNTLDIEYEKYSDMYVFSKISTSYLKDNIEPLTIMDKVPIILIAKNLPQYFTQKQIEHLKFDIDNQKGIIYRRNDKIIGFLLYFSSQGVVEISWLGVASDFQNQGIDKALKDEFNNICKHK